VLGGPFRGMRYVSEAQGSVLIPKLLGIYEKELNPTIEGLVRGNFPRIYVIGAGEGYYAAGMALRNPGAQVVAYEANEAAHKLIREVVERNAVTGRVAVHGLCSDADMRSLPGGSLVIMDVEGAEEHLLDPASFSGLRDCTILFEAHFSPAKMQSGILARFANSHTITRINSEVRRWSDVESLPLPLVFYIRRNIGLWLDEMRGGTMQWYLMSPKRNIS
jgi:hypothetical protein